MGRVTNASIRISDDERDQAVSALGAHLTTGRLEMAEYEERVGQATAARTRGELEVLFTDLPMPHPDLSSATPPTQFIQKTGQLVSNPRGRNDQVVRSNTGTAFEIIAGLTVLLGVPAAILLTIFLGMWWLFIPVGVVVVVAGSIADATKKPTT